jgi:hypothetical protein
MWEGGTMPDVDDQTQVDVDGAGETTETDTSEVDETADDTPSDDEKPGDGDKVVEHKGKEAREFVDEILSDYGLESADELKDFMANLSQLKGKIGDRDLDEIIKNSETLETYQAHWAKQEREKKKEGETPEDTIKRLEAELDESQDEKTRIIDQRKEARAAEVAVREFNDTVTSVIKADKAIPAEYQPFLAEFMGVDNPINDIDIDNKAEVRKLTKAGIKKLQAFEQEVIKRYRAGKTAIPKVSSTDTSSVIDDPKKKEPKNLKDARRIMHQSLSAIFSKKA